MGENGILNCGLPTLMACGVIVKIRREYQQVEAILTRQGLAAAALPLGILKSVSPAGLFVIAEPGI